MWDSDPQALSAAAINLSADGASQRLSQYELGVHDPSFELVEKFAQLLGLPTPFFYAKDDQLADWILAFGKRDGLFTSYALDGSVTKQTRYVAGKEVPLEDD